MTQYLRPDADTYIGNYEDQAAGTSDIFEAIDEVSPSDADYIISPETPSNEVYTCALSSVEDPLSSANHVVKYRYRKNNPTGDQIDLVVELREGYVNEGSPGTLIKGWTHTDIGDTAATATQTLSAGEAASITDYSDLFLRFDFNRP